MLSQLLRFSFLSAFSLCAIAKPIYISHFSTEPLAQWQQKSFAGETDYQIITLDNKKVLQAHSNDNASSLYKEIRVDLKKTPYLNWSWRNDTPLQIKNETIKQGDDFSARIYIVVKHKWAFWKTKAVNYVWSSHANKNTAWENPFAGKNVMMIAIRNQSDNHKTWFHEKRNVLQDFKQQFGEDIQFIDVVAIMTDTDNNHGNALSYYGDLYFSEQ